MKFLTQNIVKFLVILSFNTAKNLTYISVANLQNSTDTTKLLNHICFTFQFNFFTLIENENYSKRILLNILIYQNLSQKSSIFCLQNATKKRFFLKVLYRYKF